MINITIDFVIPWVDNSDPNWVEAYNKHKNDNMEEIYIGDARFRGNSYFKYWFRGVERFAPWVNKIYFLTYGHVPEWLNIDHPQIVIVKHDEFIDEKYLPTFSSRTIDLNLHKIPNLSERFVYFNDDLFIIDTVSGEDFFKEGLPLDEAIFRHVEMSDYANEYPHTLLNNVGLINRNIDFKQSVKTNYSKFINPIYEEFEISNKFYISCNSFPGLYSLHLPQPFLKSSFSELWKCEEENLGTICQQKFRHIKGVNQYIFRFWQILNGKFIPNYSRKNGFVFYNTFEELDKITSFIIHQKRKIIGINDSVKISVEQFMSVEKEVCQAFEKIFPEKSQYEK